MCAVKIYYESLNNVKIIYHNSLFKLIELIFAIFGWIMKVLGKQIRLIKRVLTFHCIYSCKNSLFDWFFIQVFFRISFFRALLIDFQQNLISNELHVRLNKLKRFPYILILGFESADRHLTVETSEIALNNVKKFKKIQEILKIQKKLMLKAFSRSFIQLFLIICKDFQLIE